MRRTSLFQEQRSTGARLISVCTTSYNCAAQISPHWGSILKALATIPFEYIATDNNSTDGTYEILKQVAAQHRNVTVFSKRCSRGTGRQLAATAATGDTILSVDADTLYLPQLRSLVEKYQRDYRPRGLALQAIYAGLYPRDLWFQVGGTRNLNYGEDLDLWMRILREGRMRWYPVAMGENLKSESERNYDDAISLRYSDFERIRRLFRREQDLLRLRRYYTLNLEAVRLANTVDLGLGNMSARWFGPPIVWTARGAIRRVTKGVTQVLFPRL